MNPLYMMQIKGMLDKFRKNHPKVQNFFAAAAKSVDEGSVIEMKLTTSQGKTLCSNIRVNTDDMELIRQINGLMQE